MHLNKKKILTMTSRIDNQLPDAYKYPISKTKKDLIEECKKMGKGAHRDLGCLRSCSEGGL